MNNMKNCLLKQTSNKGAVMFRVSGIIMTVLLSVNFLLAQSVSLSGTVKKTGGTAGIQGVKVTLAKLPALSTVTDATGAFSIAGDVSTLWQTPQASRLNYSLAGNSLIISPLPLAATGKVELYSSDGRQIAFTPFHGNASGKLRVGFPELGSGITMLRITINGETVTRSIVRLGNALYIKNASTGIGTYGDFNLTKQAAAAAVDTLIASKTGYKEARVAVDSYNKQGVAITLDSLSTTCPELKLPAISAITYSNKKHPGPWDFKYMNLPRVTTKAQWECRRQEIWQMAQDYLYGHLPPKCEVTGTVSGGKITAKCSYNGKSVDVSVTANGSGEILVLDFGAGAPKPSNARSASVSGATFLSNAKSLYGTTDMGIVMASAWGVGRIIDALEQNPDCGISAKKIMVTGCSTNGKQAMGAGVFEPRVALCVPVESGCAGTCSWRVSSEYGHGNSNTDCQDITHLETNWTGTVTDNTWEKGNPTIDKLPFDQGELMALRAPGALLQVDNGKEQYKWLCNRGNTAAAQGCHWIYKALCVENNFGFIQPDPGHTHCSWPSSITPDATKFYDKFLNGKTDVNTKVFICNKESVETSKWFDFGTGKDQWDTTTVLQ
jgi:hypothetical protein